tara:strand:+ start:112 stop:279 length:168 start_codon:yes stop_codon:yes gene_type:complete
VVIKKINGNISNITEGEFRRERNIGKLAGISIFLKKSNSLNKFKINTRLSITNIT